ncbi:hypothetical protein SK803_26725 [Lentzea sp. BCCO 10_0856]|uniref:Nucleoside phosphorylase domain-containing protein n=1 Tax=Lentzea miocenica TaxID=3095431 RepID=A0ABU4T6Q2_9PSEU|nr:hypothetical protein [Lentzea sp. BCCO 10_0856]MDX8033832.1 hypothetical protein [Lentzea sp. BCCO 10_0856]
MKLGIVLRADRIIREEGFRPNRQSTAHGPVDRIFSGKMSGVETHFLYGRFPGRRTPSWEIPFEANQSAFDELGVDHVIGTFVVGGVAKNVRTGDLVIPHDLIAFSGPRVSLPPLHGAYSNAHVIPSFCKNLRELLLRGSRETGIPVHEQGVYVSFYGFSRVETLAELELFDRLGISIVGQTLDPEFTLVRRRHGHYGAIAVAVDSYHDMRDQSQQDPEEFRARSRGTIRQGREKMEAILQAGIASMGSSPFDGNCGCVRAHSGKHPDMFASYPEDLF